MSLHEMTPAEIVWYEAEHGHKVGEFLPQYPDPRAHDLKLQCPSCLTREIAHLTPMAMEAEALREKLSAAQYQLDEARAERDDAREDVKVLKNVFRGEEEKEKRWRRMREQWEKRISEYHADLMQTTTDRDFFRAAHEAATKRIGKLEEGLRPFAECGRIALLDLERADEDVLLVIAADDAPVADLTRADFRRARALLTGRAERGE